MAGDYFTTTQHKRVAYYIQGQFSIWKSEKINEEESFTTKSEG
jgi:hypothetical protein